MLDRTAAAKSKPSLNGMVFCARCGSEMADTGQRYYCPNTTMEAGGSCNVRPADAQGLLSSVVARMVNRLATEETVQHITDTIKKITGAGRYRTKMENYEAWVAYTTGEALPIPRDIEDGASLVRDSGPMTLPPMTLRAPDTRTYREPEDQTKPPHGASPASEARASRDQLDKAEFINDEEGIREAVTDPRSYLGGNSDEETQELLELVVGKVLVDSSSAKIVYKEALPLDGHPEGIREDLVELGPAATD